MTAHLLLIGVNYTGTNNELSGCINDIKSVKKLFVDKFKIPKENIRSMHDFSSDAMKPTGKNIKEQLKWLVEKSSESDYVFLHFSGHGTQTYDRNGDEKDGRDELICPIDFPNDYLTDDYIFNNLMMRIGK